MYIAVFLSILTLFPIVHSIVNMFFSSDNLHKKNYNFNLVFCHLHPPPRSVALIRQRLPLLSFPSQFNISCLLLWCLSLVDVSSFILCILHNFVFLVCHYRTWKLNIHTNILCKWTFLSLCDLSICDLYIVCDCYIEYFSEAVVSPDFSIWKLSHNFKLQYLWFN